MINYILITENDCTVGAVEGLHGASSDTFLERMTTAVGEHFCEEEITLDTSLSEIQDAITNTSTISVIAYIGDDKEKVVLVVSPLWVY